MQISLKAALTSGALLYGCPRPGHLTPDSGVLPVQLNIIKRIDISQFDKRAHCETQWEAHFYHKKSAAKEGLIVLTDREAEEIYLAIKGYFRLDMKAKIQLGDFIEEIERNWSNKNTIIDTHYHKETKTLIRGLRP